MNGKLPQNSKLRKEIPLFTFLSEYFPDVFVAMASLSFKANEKHNPGQPMHWSREKSADHKDCAIRHFLDEEHIDPATGWPEAVAAAWRACANAQLVIERMRKEGRLPAWAQQDAAAAVKEAIEYIPPLRFKPVSPEAASVLSPSEREGVPVCIDCEHPDRCRKFGCHQKYYQRPPRTRGE